MLSVRVHQVWVRAQGVGRWCEARVSVCWTWVSVHSVHEYGGPLYLSTVRKQCTGERAWQE